MEELQVFLHPEYCNCVFVPVIERREELCVGCVLVFSFKPFSYGFNIFLLKNDIIILKKLSQCREKPV